MTAKNTHMKLMETIICRTPVFGIEDDLKSRWPELKELIKEASPDFHKVIAEWDHEELAKANEKVIFSVWKYFNRARFRSTPFGNFGAISFVPVQEGHNNDGESLCINSKLVSHRYTDWSEKDNHLQSAKKIVQNSVWFQSNSTGYVVAEQLRYIRYTGSQFELASVTVFEELTYLLSACRAKQNKADIYELMHAVFGMKKRTVDNMLCQLVECQLLLTEIMPNVIGGDYFKRLSLPRKNTALAYIIAQRTLNNGRLDTAALDVIPEYLGFIKDIIPRHTNPHLEAFRQEFSKKFDMRAVPLSIALEPETGIGYGDMAQDPQEPALSAVFANMQKKAPAGQSFTYTAQHRFLLNALIKGDTIQLEAFENTIDSKPQQLPNTLSVIFQYWNGMPVLQTAGGCTANALLGRFTLSCEEAEKFTRQIVEAEETANPDVIFFDIAYQAEKQVDNVNRRKQIYNYELPILTWSCSGSALSMDDIWVMLRGDEVILWSKQHSKRLVPRIATAYNYSRSDLAVYRFLCDLQHQHLQSDVTFSLQKIFPGLDHYPRVMYKNIIISPAKWKIDTQTMFSGNKEKDMERLTVWLRSNHIINRFKCGNTDQTLCLDPANAHDVEAFITLCRQNNGQEMYIQEALTDETSLVADETGRQYLPQYIASYFHKERVYRTLGAYGYSPVVREGAASGNFLPGSEWLYFEIYSHPSRANDILKQCAGPTLSKLKKHLHKWFFIRYNDPKPHIRLRLQMKDISSAVLLIAEMKGALEPLWMNGLITDIQIKTYNREMERYGQYRIDKVEELFYHDSRYVMRLIPKNFTTDKLHSLSLKMMNRLFAMAFEDVTRRLHVIKTIADNFSNEFLINHEGYKAINKSYETLKTYETNSPKISEASLEQHDAAFCNILNEITEAEKTNLVSDLVHMHINRVFPADQRMHEAILYQYLQKLAIAHQRRAIAAQALLSPA